MGRFLRAMLVLMLAGASASAEDTGAALMWVEPEVPEGSAVKEWDITAGFKVRACHTTGGKYVLRMNYRRGSRTAEVSSATLAKKLPGGGGHAYTEGHYASPERALRDAGRFRLWVELGFPNPSRLPAAALDQEFADPGDDPVSLRAASDRERARRRREEGQSARVAKVRLSLVLALNSLLTFFALCRCRRKRWRIAARPPTLRGV